MPATITVVNGQTTLKVGENTVVASAAATSAAASAAIAEAFAGPTYADIAAGLAGTVDGEYFAVNASGIVTIYLNDGGSAVSQRVMVTTAALAADDGADRVGFLQDGTGAVARTLREKILSLHITTGDMGTISHATAAATNLARMQAMLNEAANITREGAREVVLNVDGFPQLSGPLVVPSRTRLILTGKGALAPESANGFGIRSHATVPSTYTALAANALRYADAVQLGSTTGFDIGDIVFLRSNANLPDTGVGTFNSGGGTVGSVPVKCGQVLRIMGKTSTMLYFDAALEYNYLTADTAEIAVVPDAFDRLRVEGFRWGDPEDYDARGVLPGNGISVSYGMDVEIVGHSVWNRAVGGADSTSNNGALLTNVVGARIEADYIQTSYYGATVNGACRAVRIIGGRYHKNRHATSLNWTWPYGEPLDTLVTDVEATDSVLSTFDCHDVGRRTTYRNCVGKKTSDDIFQVRSRDVTIQNCYAAGSFNDAVGASDSARGLRVLDITMRNCGRGTRLTPPDAIIDGVDAWDSGTLGGLLCTAGGEIRNVRAHSGNGGGVGIIRALGYTAGARLVVENLYAPYNAADQNIMFFGFTDLTGLTVKNIDAPGWPAASVGNLFRAGTAATPTEPDVEHIKIATTGPMRGQVTLVAGVATISTGNVISFAGGGAAGQPPLRSNIQLTRVASGGTPGIHYEVTAITNGTSFAVAALKADGTTETADTSTIAWKLS